MALVAFTIPFQAAVKITVASLWGFIVFVSLHLVQLVQLL